MRKPIDYARRYLDQHPEAASLPAARALVAKYPDVWPNLEAAHTCVRRARGSQGEKHRKQVKDPRPRSKATEGSWAAPESAAASQPPIVKIPGAGHWLLISDPHCPYHDQKALTTAIRHGQKEGCENLYINGDFLDNHRLSRYEADEDARSTVEELQVGRRILEQWSKMFDRRVFKIGNHDDRWRLYLNSRTPEFSRLPGMALTGQLGLLDMGYQVLASKQVGRLGKLPVYHGHELPKGLVSAVNPGRGMYLRLHETAICGHFHQPSTHTEPTGLHKRSVVCWSTGCLSGLWPNYAIVNKWSHGWATVKVASSGVFEVRNWRITDGEVTPV